MSTAMVSMVLDCFPEGGGLCLLAIAMADAADDEGGSIFKSVETLAHQSKQSARTVQRVLPTLVAGGWLEVISSATGGRGRATVYRIAPSWITRCAVERAQARLEGRKPARVGLVGVSVVSAADVPPGAPPVAELSTDGPIKGDKLAPFLEAEKGDKNPVKGDKNGLKGDSYGCHPNMNKERNTPLPPNGGRAVGDVDNSEGGGGGAVKAEQPVGQAGAKGADRPGAKPGAQAVAKARSDGVGDADGFELNFWRLYPRAVDEQLSRRAWLRLSPGPDLQREIAAAVRAWAASDEWRRDGGRYVPKPHRWLARRRWTDVPGLAGAPPAVDEAQRTREMLAARAAVPRLAPDEVRRRVAQARALVVQGAAA